MRKVIIGFLSLISLTGCWDQAELEEMAYVIVVGIDKGPGRDFIITYQITNTQVGTSDRVQSDEDPYEIVSVTAPDFLTAVNLVNATVSREITFAHTKVFIVSADIAKSNEFLEQLHSSIRARHVRRNTLILVTKEKAEAFIRENKPTMETRPHKFYAFIQGRWEDLGLSPYKSTIHNFLKVTNEDASLFLGIYGTTKKNDKSGTGGEDQYIAGEIDIKEKNRAQIFGSAVFKEGKMIGTLTGEEKTRMTWLLQDAVDIKRMLATYTDPINSQYRISTELEILKKPTIRINMKSQPLRIDVNVPISVHVLAVPSNANYSTNLNNQLKLEKSIAQNLEKKADEFIKRTQEQFKAEPFLWSLEARKQFFTNKQFADYDWFKQYPSAIVNVNFDVTLSNFGKQYPPTDLDRIKD